MPAAPGLKAVSLFPIDLAIRHMTGPMGIGTRVLFLQSTAAALVIQSLDHGIMYFRQHIPSNLKGVAALPRRALQIIHSRLLRTAKVQGI